MLFYGCVIFTGVLIGVAAKAFANRKKAKVTDQFACSMPKSEIVSRTFTAEDFPSHCVQDPIMAEVMARAMNTGKIIFANRREDGSVEFEEIEKNNG